MSNNIIEFKKRNVKEEVLPHGIKWYVKALYPTESVLEAYMKAVICGTYQMRYGDEKIGDICITFVHIGGEHVITLPVFPATLTRQTGKTEMWDRIFTEVNIKLRETIDSFVTKHVSAVHGDLPTLSELSKKYREDILNWKYQDILDDSPEIVEMMERLRTSKSNKGK